MVLRGLVVLGLLFVAACANSATIEDDSLMSPTSKQYTRPQEEEDEPAEPPKASPVCGELLRKNCPIYPHDRAHRPTNIR